jgi:CheY-specific phosphatase CheX
MKMELIQPFINAADAVFSEAFQAPTSIVDLTMEEETYRRKGVAAHILIRGEIEGRVVVDLAPEVAIRVASQLAGAPVQESDQIIRETVCELANMVIGNSVTLLNDQGFRFKVFPPEIHQSEEGLAGSRDTEAMVLCLQTPCGDIFLNISMHYMRRRRREREFEPMAEQTEGNYS